MVKYEIVDWLSNVYHINEGASDTIKSYFSMNPHDAAVDYLLEHPNFVDQITVCANRNPRMVQYILNAIQNSPDIDEAYVYLSTNPNDQIVDLLFDQMNSLVSKEELLTNPNDRVVDFILNNLNKGFFDRKNRSKEQNIQNTGIYLSENSNPRIVNFLLTNKQFIQGSICSNSNDKMIDYFLENKLCSHSNVDDLSSSILTNSNPRVFRLINEEYDINPSFRILKNPLIFVVDRHQSCIKYKISKWIDMNIKYLSANPHGKALDILERNPNRIDWNRLSKNTNSRIRYIFKDKDKINWKYMSANPSNAALDILEREYKTNPDNIDFTYLSSNTNNRAYKMIIENLDKVDWGTFVC